MQRLKRLLLSAFLVMAHGEGKCEIQSQTFELNDALVLYASGADESAVGFLSLFADRDVAVAQLLLARLYLQSSHARDCDAGISTLIRAAANGNAEASFDLGNLLLEGSCIPRSSTKAIEAFSAAVELGHTGAATALGKLYLGRADAKPDHATAAKWLRSGAAMFDSDACFQLGQLFTSAEGLRLDYEEALFWFDLAASFAFISSDQHASAVAARDSVREHLTPMQVQLALNKSRRELDRLVSDNRHRAKDQR